MSEAVTPAIATPRWKITIIPSESPNPFNAQALNEIEINAENVTRGELTAVVADFLAAVAKSPATVLPTVSAVKAYNAEQTLVAAHPATVLYIRLDGEQLWLAAEAAEALEDDINAAGWIDAGEVPAGRACEYARDPEACKNKILGVPATEAETHK